MSVVGNFSCSFGVCTPRAFEVTLPQSETSLSYQEADSWSGSIFLTVGYGFFDVPPGEVAVQIKAMQHAEWEVEFTRRR